MSCRPESRAVSTAIVTDSTAYLAGESIAEAGDRLTVVPLHVVIDGRQYAEGREVDAAALSTALRAGRPVSTSRPAPAELLAAYRQAAQRGADSVVSVHISGALSGTVEAARLAAAEAPIPVEVIDSRSIGMGMGFAVVAAFEAAVAGAGPAEITALVSARLASVSVTFCVDTLEHLRRGGRISGAQAVIGSALSIRPILGLRAGSIVPIERVRTSSRAISRLVEIGRAQVQRADACSIIDLAVHHLDAADRAEEVLAAVGAAIDQESAVRVGRVVLAELGAVIGAHTGPGTVGLVVAPRT